MSRIDANTVANLGGLVRLAAKTFADSVIFRFEGKSLTFLQLEQQTNRLANVLQALGVKQGDRIAVMLPNGFEFPISWLSIAKLGAIIVPINTQYQHDDLRFVLRDAGTSLIVSSAEFLPLIKNVQPECEALKTIALFGASDTAFDLESAMKNSNTEFDLPDITRDTLVNLQYTSGTTGFPKGCMLSHSYWLELGQRSSELLQCDFDDVDFTVQPFYYMDPQWNTVLCLLSGIRLVIVPKFSVSRFWQTIHAEEVTFFYCLGTIPIFLLKQPPNPALEQGHRLRLVSCSGIVPQFHALFETRFAVPWREAFGMTETGVDIAVPLSDTVIGSGTIGQPVPGKVARIINHSTTGIETELEANQIGELVVKGGVMMQGYWNRPDDTARALQGGWMHTGDLAYRDANNNYYLVGRLKEMIRRGSENIAASEVEAVICEHPQIQMAAVVAIPDDARGEEVKAYIQLEPNTKLEPNELLEFLRPKLARFKLPRYITFVNEFPLTPSEKIAKHKLENNTPTFDALEGIWRTL